MNPLISIIIPCYNDAQYIEQSILSALNQTYPNKEVIIVDDGSNLETKQVLKKLEPSITQLITQENQGQSTARNVGIKAARGNYILVLDSDDFFEPTFCEKAIPIFLENPLIKIVTCKANLLFKHAKTEIYTPRGGDIRNFIFTNDALGTSMFKKEDWMLCGGYDETMRSGLEDWDFFIQLLKNGGNCYVIHEVLYNYRKREGSTTFKASKLKYKILNYVYLKHKEIIIKYYENFLPLVCDTLENQEKQLTKEKNKIEYKIGKAILKPFRFIKDIYKIREN
ncbi:glycosyltransferase family 2 protein [Mariniflexile sp.]|uniref:glycosyltransferase family 2 protein n=1 Tax=Mariniflexile sp. TaxID=1979402 RepID=UPI0040485A76